MNIFQNLAGQAVAGGLSITVIYQILDKVPEYHRVWIIIAVIAGWVISSSVSVLAHFSNPDGTNAKAPYIPGEKPNEGPYIPGSSK